MTEQDERLLRDLRTAGLVAVIRGADGGWATRVGRTLMANGVTLLEVTLTTAGAAPAIRDLVTEAPDGTWVGAGTVLTEDDVREAVNAGAQFLVTPGLCPALAAGVAAGLPVLCGAWTPSEVFAAHAAGAVAVKVFPITSGGPQHLQALRGPFPDIPLVAVGGVGLQDIEPLQAAGAIAMGVGGPLTGRDDSEDHVALAETARSYVKGCAQ